MKAGERGQILAMPRPADAPERPFLAFTIGGGRYALPLEDVERVVRVVEWTRLPRAPEIVLGVVNVAGRVLPVIDVRRRFGHPPREVQLSDQMVVARTARRTLALHVESTQGLVELAEREIVRAEQVLPGLEYVRGVAKLASGLVLIHDLDTFLSLDEEQELSGALARTGT